MRRLWIWVPPVAAGGRGSPTLHSPPPTPQLQPPPPNPHPPTPNPQLPTLNSQLSTLNPQPSTLNRRAELVGQFAPHSQVRLFQGDGRMGSHGSGEPDAGADPRG